MELVELQRQLELDPDSGVDRNAWLDAGGQIETIFGVERDDIRELRRKHHLKGEVFNYTIANVEGNFFSGDKPFMDWSEEEREKYWEDTVQAKMADNFKNYTRTISDMKTDGPASWILQRTLPTRGLGQLFAESYAGKTICVVDLVCSMATGQMWFHGTKLRTKGEPMRTLYIGAEGGTTLRSYFEGWEYGHPNEDANLINENVEIRDGGIGKKVLMSLDVMKKTPDAPDYDGSYDQMIDYINWLPEDKKPHLVVFDTQIDLMNEADENNNTEYGKLLGRLQMDASTLGILFLLIHHTGHDDGDKKKKKRGRGASSQKSKMDAYLELGIIGDGEDTFRRELIPHKVKGSTATPDKKITYQTKRAEMPFVDEEGEYILDEYGDKETYELFWAEDIDPNDFEGLVNSFSPPQMPNSVVLRVQAKMARGEKYSLNQVADILDVGARNSKRFQSTLESLLYHRVLHEASKTGRSRQIELYPY